MEEKQQEEQQRLPVQVGMSERGLAPRDMNELWKFSSMIAGSDLAPKQYIGKPANVAVAIEMGMELGLRPMQALQNIAVVNGRPSIYGDAALALVKTSGLCRAHREVFDGEPYQDTFRCIVTTQRVGEEPHVEEFSVGDAKRAELWGKQGPWKQYPRRMLQMRARGFALRNVYPDVLMGTLTSEEAGDVIETTATHAAPPTDSQRDAEQPASKAAGLAQRLAAAKGPREAMPEGGPMPGEAPDKKPAAAAQKNGAAKAATSKPAADLDAAIERANRAFDDAMDAGIDARKVLMGTVGQSNLDDLSADQVERARAALAEAVAGLEPPDDAPKGEAREGLFD